MVTAVEWGTSKSRKYLVKNDLKRAIFTHTVDTEYGGALRLYDGPP